MSLRILFLLILAFQFTVQAKSGEGFETVDPCFNINGGGNTWSGPNKYGCTGIYSSESWVKGSFPNQLVRKEIITSASSIDKLYELYGLKAQRNVGRIWFQGIQGVLADDTREYFQADILGNRLMCFTPLGKSTTKRFCIEVLHAMGAALEEHSDEDTGDGSAIL